MKHETFRPREKETSAQTAPHIKVVKATESAHQKVQDIMGQEAQTLKEPVIPNLCETGFESQSMIQDIKSDVPIYLCGPMSGKPDFNRSLFNMVNRLLIVDYNVTPSNIMNPASMQVSIGYPGYNECFKSAVSMMMKSNAMLVMLDFWRSKGAMAEISLAHALGKTMYHMWPLGDNFIVRRLFYRHMLVRESDRGLNVSQEVTFSPYYFKFAHVAVLGFKDRRDVAKLIIT